MNSKLVNFNKYPITLDYTNYKGVRDYYRKVIPNFIFYGVGRFHGNSPSWFLHGICMNRQQSRDFKVDDIHYWDLKHSIPPKESGLRIDHDYRLLIKKGLSTEINCSFLNNIYCIKDAATVNSVYCANIYHIPDLKYHLNETFKKDDTIIFAQNLSLKIPPMDYFL